MAMDSKDFMTKILPRLSGPSVRIRILKEDTTVIGEYSAPAELLKFCSPFFASAFQDDGTWKEGEYGVVDLPEMEGVVSCESVEMLLQLFYQQQVNVSNNPHVSEGQQISRLIEFAHLLDFVGTDGVDFAGRLVTEQVKKILAEDDSPFIAHMSFLKVSHLRSIFALPPGHALQHLLVEACVRSKIETEVDEMPCGYLGSEFRGELQKLPWAASKLEELITIAMAKVGNYRPPPVLVPDTETNSDTNTNTSTDTDSDSDDDKVKRFICGRTEDDWFLDPLTGKVHKHLAWQNMNPSLIRTRGLWR
ncbi:uncharacterized protein BP5553_09974 [Venustampulla echinocandica]|uniref:BTB domain-containing protein n=1 Tax=Venustampulla echinocandica TaxID=2656787 RepID=A0A370TB89_9HELO|nr:uncharacterized protein BP5553_09974 [Venustampulla echinocandica]RDL31185.1 hypothetical protein BP5553_09974 [Venustampulla echinocandica]